MLIKYANKNKENDKCYKYFSDVAYLIEIAYPGVFKPYQFKLGNKTKEYFDKRKYITSLIDVIENKLCINLDNVEALVKCNGFLSKDELRFYGLTEHLYKHLFENKQNMLDELVKVISMNKSMVNYKNTNVLKKLLRDDNIDINKCYVNNCECKGIEIHHIHAKRFGVFNKIDDVQNLIPLCPYHHDMVFSMTPKELSKDMSKWREDVSKYIEEYENNNLN
ncbi:HNH endonuclease signature motif containing protein [Paraclostridium bifermentans]|uniref:HNH endonuclease signature motif containing protein n=1 Tax=Paraclostridium bifermentans TaxID=1490 RepID=A0ABY8R211_PARBF|nr:HNH endonuclease signature motif containing protein [Paraclostridium bifermentans]